LRILLKIDRPEVAADQGVIDGDRTGHIGHPPCVLYGLLNSLGQSVLLQVGAAPSRVGELTGRITVSNWCCASGQDLGFAIGLKDDSDHS
jgi:hypothetical protein